MVNDYNSIFNFTSFNTLKSEKFEKGSSDFKNNARKCNVQISITKKSTGMWCSFL